MSTVNGAITPSEVSQTTNDTSGIKRKHSEVDGHAVAAQLPGPDNRADVDSKSSAAIAQVQDVFRLLQGNDTKFSILDTSLEDADQSSQDEAPPAKRARLSSDMAPRTVSTIFKQGLYSDLARLEEDVMKACAVCLNMAKNGTRQEHGHVKIVSAENIKNMQHLMSFESSARDIFSRARSQWGRVSSMRERISNGDSTNIKVEPRSPKRFPEPSGSSVLSLFGNAPTPRQLFSSLQNKEGPELPLEEMGLPNMLTSTKLLPMQGDGLKSKSTFGQVFGPPASLPQLQPPKPARSSSKSSTSISFVPSDTLPKASRKSGYPSQPMIVGDWLAYGRSDRNKDNASSSSKRKHKDRSTSVGESTGPDSESVATDGHAQEAELFRAAFSSFAPTHDNSKALVPEEDRNMVWWRKAGDDRFHDHFAIDPALVDETPAVDPEDIHDAGRDDEIKLFEEVIKNFDEALMNHDILHPPIDILPDDMLSMISELLQTLSSHQRIRNAFVAPTTRTPASPSPLLSAIMGTPTDPSVEETDVYKALRFQLADLIDRLPPYLVAKLDGEQLEDLRINKKILLEETPYPGVLEEDQPTRIARSNAAAAANLTSRATSGASQPSTQTGRTPSVSGPSRSAHAPQTYYGGSKTPAASYNRPSQSYNTPINAGGRQNYSQLAAYTAPVNRTTTQQSYGQGVNNMNFNRVSQSQQYGQGSPQPQAPRPAGTAQQALYQNRAQNSVGYGQNSVIGSPHARPDSPAKPAYNPQAAYGQPRPAYAQMQADQRQQAQPGSGLNSPRPVEIPQIPPTDGQPGYATNTAVDQQRIMIERQRAQLAAQPQARMAAGAEVSRPSSSTPQPATPAPPAQTNSVPSGS